MAAEAPPKAVPFAFPKARPENLVDDFRNAVAAGATIDTLKDLWLEATPAEREQMEKLRPGSQEDLIGGKRKRRKSRRNAKKTKKAMRKGKKSYSRRR